MSAQPELPVICRDPLGHKRPRLDWLNLPVQGKRVCRSVGSACARPAGVEVCPRDPIGMAELVELAPTRAAPKLELYVRHTHKEAVTLTR